MKRFVPGLVALAALAVAPPLTAQTAYLVKDIAPAGMTRRAPIPSR